MRSQVFLTLELAAFLGLAASQPIPSHCPVLATHTT